MAANIYLAMLQLLRTPRNWTNDLALQDIRAMPKECQFESNDFEKSLSIGRYIKIMT
jgi:hypothetical protein